jgi:hypothetical protein
VCELVRKLLKICTGWLDPNAIGAYGQYPDEYKIKKGVLLKEFPTLCDNLVGLALNNSCAEIRREVTSNSALHDDLYSYAKKNLLWLNVYVKDSFSTHIVRDERMTRIRDSRHMRIDVIKQTNTFLVYFSLDSG